MSYFSLQCFDTVGWATGRASGLEKRLGVGLLVVMIWLELCTTYSSSCRHHFHHPQLQLTPANPGSPGEWPLRRREKHVLIKVTLSCQRHCRGTAQSLTSKKRTGRSADSWWLQADNSCSVVQLRSPNEDGTTTEKVRSSGRDGTSPATAHSWRMTANCSTHTLKPLERRGRRIRPAWLSLQNADGCECRRQGMSLSDVVHYCQSVCISWVYHSLVVSEFLLCLPFVHCTIFIINKYINK